MSEVLKVCQFRVARRRLRVGCAMSSKTTKFEGLLEAVPDALVGVDHAGVIRFVNRQTELLFGYERDDLIGAPLETESLRTTQPGIIVLDHGLSGQLTGLDAAPRLKELAPQAKIIMFTAHANLKTRADNEPAIDGFVLKTESTQLLPLAQRLTGLGAPPK